MTDEVGNRSRMARRVSHRDLAAIGHTDTDDWAESEMLAQCLHVLDVFIQRVGGGIAARGTAVTAMVEVNELHVLGERRERRLETGVVGAGTAVNDQGYGPFAHCGAIRYQPSPFDVEVDLGITNLRAHALALQPAPTRTEQITGSSLEIAGIWV